MKHIIYKGDTMHRIKEMVTDCVQVHLTVTSPPYYNAKEYNKEDVNVGNNETYHDYMLKIEELISDIYDVTIPGGIVVWNTSPVIYEGRRYPIPFDTNKIFMDNGFEFMEDILAAIMDANNFKEEDMKKTGIKDFIKKKQEQIKEQKEKEDAESNKPA